MPADKTNDSETLAQVIQQFRKREAAGIKTYGTTVARNDLTTQQWVQHLQEELMDAVLYLERLKQTLK